MMKKSPDEIKKGLETCIGKCTGNKPHCPYHECGDGCMDSMNRDALALIQQLERERDAAVRDMAVIKPCAVCRHDDTKDHLPFACTSCGDGKQNWRWRGLCKENGGST